MASCLRGSYRLLPVGLLGESSRAREAKEESPEYYRSFLGRFHYAESFRRISDLIDQLSQGGACFTMNRGNHNFCNRGSDGPDPRPWVTGMMRATSKSLSFCHLQAIAD